MEDKSLGYIHHYRLTYSKTKYYYSLSNRQMKRFGMLCILHYIFCILWCCFNQQSQTILHHNPLCKNYYLSYFHLCLDCLLISLRIKQLDYSDNWYSSCFPYHYMSDNLNRILYKFFLWYRSINEIRRSGKSDCSAGKEFLRDYY